MLSEAAKADGVTLIAISSILLLSYCFVHVDSDVARVGAEDLEL
jgi:hypothetical protein